MDKSAREEIIGATKRVETNWLRIEITADGSFHGHPITVEAATDYLNKINK